MSKMTNCKTCGKEIAKGINKCPHCGADQRNFFMKHKIISVILGLLVIGIIGSAIGGSKTGNNSNTNVAQKSTNIKNKVAEKPKYEILEQKATEENGIKYIAGKIKNNTGRQISYAQVEINLYDENNQLLGSTLANVNNLEKDSIWNFKALVTQENYKSYKIMKVTGF